MNRLTNTSRVAFFLCDIQAKFSPHIFHYEAIVGTATKMIKAAQILQLPLIVTEQLPDKLGPTDSNLPLPSDNCFKFTKSSFSMLTCDVLGKLDELKTDHVVLFGIEAHVCVLQTALDLLERGIAVTVIKDGVSSCNQGEIATALEVSHMSFKLIAHHPAP
ncbi:Isochorismatase-like protein [Obelidium mucronatum]|nr:Isochorismatase-like protein [Obelidium mucronatum]